MQPAGDKLISKWRESGEWWNGSLPIEVRQYRAATGKLFEQVAELSGAQLEEKQAQIYNNSRREEICLRPRKLRDEKVAIACGQDIPKPHIHIHKAATQYVPLHVQSGYSLGRSIMFTEEIARLSAQYGCPAACISDAHSLVGAVEFALECKRVGIRPLIGSSFELASGGHIVLIARDKSGYRSLSRLITECHLQEPRLYPLCSWERMMRHSRGLLCLTGGSEGPIDRFLMARDYQNAASTLERLLEVYGKDAVFIEVERSYLPWQMHAEAGLKELAERYSLLQVAGGVMRHSRPEDFPAQDALVCADTLCLVDEILGRKPLRERSQPQVPSVPIRSLNAERYLRSCGEAAMVYCDRPELLQNTLIVAEKCDADVLPTRTRLPKTYPNSFEALRELVSVGAAAAYPKLLPSLNKRIEFELSRICRLDFADHFLIMHDACRWATGKQILYSGRGSVVDSVVAYCLGLSNIDAFRHNLHFDRFLPEDGSKRPDIDIDFEAHRRDDVRNYLTCKYGPEQVATVCAIGAYCSRGIVREVGKALGLSQQAIGFLAKRIHGGVAPDQLRAAMDARPELRDSNLNRERFEWVFRLASMLADVPRNIRAHSSGVVISDEPICDTVPVMWSGSSQEGDEISNSYLRIIQWDKRSAKHYFDKFDILCLRGQDVLSGTQRRVRLRDGDFDVTKLSLDDEEAYRAMRAGELIGIPQSASPAMRQAHQRLRTSDLHDASLVQAGIRPGVGGSVKLNELIARRLGKKQYTFDHPLFEKVLGITYGIIVFQEQVDQLLQEFAGFTSGEAEDTREKIHKWRKADYGTRIHDDLIARICARGFGCNIAEQVYELVAGFKGYGFAQGHALAFADLSLRSIHCEQNYPSAYFASLLSAQPAGYYGPCTLANEARSRGVKVLHPDVNASELEYKVEDFVSDEPRLVIPEGAIRIGLDQIGGISAALKQAIIAGRPYLDIYEFVASTCPDANELDRLILSGALDSLYDNRRALLWAAPELLVYSKVLRSTMGSASLVEHPKPQIDNVCIDFSVAEKAIRERQVLQMDVERHLMCFERQRVSGKGGITVESAKRLASGKKAIVVGNPLRLRFPPTPSGRRVVFFDLEDETGLLNVTCFDDVYRADGHTIVCSPYVTIIGEAQDRDGHTAFLAKMIFPYNPCLASESPLREMPIATADFLVG